MPRYNTKQLRALGITASSPERAKGERNAKKRAAVCADQLFDRLCEAHGLPLPVHEFAFAAHLGRKWRADYTFDGWLIVEKEGGAFVGGRHTQGAGFREDLEKYNTATALGYGLLRFLPEQFESGEAFSFIRAVLSGEEVQP